MMIDTSNLHIHEVNALFKPIFNLPSTFCVETCLGPYWSQNLPPMPGDHSWLFSIGSLGNTPSNTVSKLSLICSIIPRAMEISPDIFADFGSDHGISRWDTWSSLETSSRRFSRCFSPAKNGPKSATAPWWI